jgi:hypothetical protein
LDSLLIGGSCIFQPKRHSRVGICTEWGDERRLDLIFFLKVNLMVARVAIKEREQDAASHGVNDLIDAWEREGVHDRCP